MLVEAPLMPSRAEMLQTVRHSMQKADQLQQQLQQQVSTSTLSIASQTSSSSSNNLSMSIETNNNNNSNSINQASNDEPNSLIEGENSIFRCFFFRSKQKFNYFQ